MLLYTDGVVETRRPGGIHFELDRLKEMLHAAAAAGEPDPETLRPLSIAAVDVSDGTLVDDATMLLIF